MERPYIQSTEEQIRNFTDNVVWQDIVAWTEWEIEQLRNNIEALGPEVCPNEYILVGTLANIQGQIEKLREVLNIKEFLLKLQEEDHGRSTK